MNQKKWQGRLDSNQRMAGSKPAALPLGDAPVSIVTSAGHCLFDGEAGEQRRALLRSLPVRRGPVQEWAQIYQLLRRVGSKKWK
jgi:hypothetical protein